MSADAPPERGPALAGLKVLDLTRVIAGPLATQILGDLGADVVKVERPGEGDDVRRTGPPWKQAADGSRVSTYFLAVNRNKRSIEVDFTEPAGAELLVALAREADVFVENFRPGTLARYGLDYARLQAVNPRLIYCSISGFGQTGPYAERSGYDYLAQAMSGIMTVNGPSGGEPTRVGVPIADMCAGHYAAIGILAALNDRSRTGLGQAIDIALYEAQLAALLNAFSGWFNGGEALGLTGNDHPSASPYGVFEVEDGQILIATFSDREFVRLAEALGYPEWSSNELFATNAARVANREALRTAMTDALRGRARDAWISDLTAAKVSCGPLNGIADLERDPQVQARGSLVTQTSPNFGAVRSIASPVRLSANVVPDGRAPPDIGEHTTEVTRDWLGGAGPAQRALLSSTEPSPLGERNHEASFGLTSSEPAKGQS